MSLTTSYPGVYVIEKSSGVGTITGVATSISMFLGFTARRLVNEPEQTFSLVDYERAFGVSVDSPVTHVVRHFYADGGGQALAVRVVRAAEVSADDANPPDLGAASAEIAVDGGLRVQGVPLLGLGVPGPAGPRCEREGADLAFTNLKEFERLAMNTRRKSGPSG
jgi:hypothetical protein